MRKYRIKALSCLLCSIFMLVPFSSCSAQLKPKDIKSDEGAVRVMSFNIRCLEFRQRKALVPRLIKEYSPDLLGLQECTHRWYKRLKSSLPEYEFIGVGRDTGDLDKNCGEISGIMFRRDKYSLVDSGTFWLSEAPDEVSFGWDAACRRVCTWAVLLDKESGRSIAHVNTHLDHQGKLAMANGARMVCEKALSFDMPTVVTGDFNIGRGEIYSSITASGLRNSQDMAKISMQGKTFHNYKGGIEGEAIDYIFLNSKINSVLCYKIVRDIYKKQYPSDHYPIYADILM